MVICRICSKEFHYVSNTHVKKHNLTLKEYISKFGNEIKSIEYKKKAYKNSSKRMSYMRRNGIIVPGPMSLERRKFHSERMKLNNPMKNPLIARKVGDKLRGTKQKPRTFRQRLNISKSKRGCLNPRWTGGQEVPNYLFWYKDRKAALERDNYRCVNCRMSNDEHIRKYKKGLHVHHVKPYRNSKDNSISNLVTLCIGCHLKEEVKSRIKFSLIDLEPDHIMVKATRRKGNASVRD